MNKEFVAFLKAKISIVDVISSRVRLRKSGKDWFGLCPFHKEKTGSFKVDADAGYYYCFGCGAHGDVITFLQEFEHITFVEAVEQLANQYGIPIPKDEKTEYVDPNYHVYEALNEIKNWFVKQLREKIGPEDSEYLRCRKISSESIDKFQLGYAPDDNSLQKFMSGQGFRADTLLKTGVFNRSKYDSGLINRYKSRLIFPIFDIAGRCVGFGGRTLDKSNVAKYINSPETDVFVKSRNLYGYSIAKKQRANEIVITEGYLDVISMHQAGFNGTVAPLGTSISETQISMCWKMCDYPIIALDGDMAGVKASYRWIDKILSVLQAGKSFKFAQLPQGADPDILISSGKSDVIAESIKHSIPLSEWLWNGALQLYPSETPEQKAAIVAMLSEKISLIKNDSVRKLYLQMLKREEKYMYSGIRKRTSCENVTPVISVREKMEKIFIVTILNHPYIISNVFEYFVQIEFANQELLELKNKILECYENSRDDMQKYAAETSSIREKRLDLNGEVALYAGFVAQSVSDEVAVNGWTQLWERYSSIPSIVADLQKATSSLKSSFSEVDWQRLKALKQEAIRNQMKQ